MLMLLCYNCTGIYIVKYRQSIAFGNIFIGGLFLGSREGEKPQKTTESRTSRCLLALLNITLCSLDINISAVCTTALDKE